MDKIRIVGGKNLVGEIKISGAKNAALPLMVTSLLTDEEITLRNLPDLADVSSMSNLLTQLGVVINVHGDDVPRRVISMKAAEIVSSVASYDVVRKMRASVLVLGPLLARRGEARVSLPGGCAIGTRPIDLHISGLRDLGAEIEIRNGYISACAPSGLKGARIVMPRVSVGATENLLMAASLARGDTILENVAREPEVVDLARCLIAMGAVIEGVGTNELRIQGTNRLQGADYLVLPDRIEAATYAMAAAITDGELILLDAKPEFMEAALSVLRRIGVEFSEVDRGLQVFRRDAELKSADLTTEPYPGFPTDLQAQIMAVMAIAEGASLVTETIFENRFMHVPELARMGADIHVSGSSALIRGVKTLRGAPVMATDLRASVSLVLAGLAAEGETLVNRVYHLDRGYEGLEQKLASCGAIIERIRG